MKIKIKYFIILILTMCFSQSAVANQTIFTFGGDINLKFVEYVVGLTNKEKPKVCYVPTASADSDDNIKYWKSICSKLGIEPYILKVWVSSNEMAETFEEILLGMDAIVVGGGNTLNMLGIWKIQEIDKAMKKALQKGIILAGGSAGSICWFQSGISDSRPVNLSIVNGLAFLPYSNCPHYDQIEREELYHNSLKNKTIKSGYASDNLAGILFRDGKVVEAVSLDRSNNSYYVYAEKGIIKSQKLDSRILLSKNALSDTAYKTLPVNRKISGFSKIFSQETPLDAFVSLQYLFAGGEESKLKSVSASSIRDKIGDLPDSQPDGKRVSSIMNCNICQILICNDLLSGVISKNNNYYSLWYFAREDGKWLSMGEDASETEAQAEITFREKAKTMMEKIRK